MSSITKTNTFVATEDARADEVNQNFSELETFCNARVPTKDGSRPYTVAPQLPSSDPSAHTHAVRKSFQDKHPRLKYLGFALVGVNPPASPPDTVGGYTMVLGTYTGTVGASGSLLVPIGYTFPTCLVNVNAFLINNTTGSTTDDYLHTYTTSSFKWFLGGLESTSVSISFVAIGI